MPVTLFKGYTDERDNRHRRKKGKKRFYIEMKYGESAWTRNGIIPSDWRRYWKNYDSKKARDQALEDLKKNARINEKYRAEEDVE